MFASPVNLISLSHGCMVGWLTPVLPLLKSDNTPLTTGPLSLEDVSWMASIAPIGSVFSALILRWITTRIGSKRMMTNCLAIVSVVSFPWLLYCISENILIRVFRCRYAGYFSPSAERNTKFSFRDLCVVSLLPASIRHSYYSWLKSQTIGNWTAGGSLVDGYPLTLTFGFVLAFAVNWDRWHCWFAVLDIWLLSLSAPMSNTRLSHLFTWEFHSYSSQYFYTCQTQLHIW